ncbi:MULTISPECIES: hypothetical protein [Bacteroidaceae]|nr:MULTISPECIES: hypothetical protein [Bacteroidaceae]
MKDDIEAGYMNVVSLWQLGAESRIIKYKIRQKCEYLYSMPYISSNE